MPRLLFSGMPTDGNALRYEPRAACFIKSTSRAKDARVFEPVLTSLRTHVWAELGDQSLAKRREPALAEHLPYSSVRKALECRDFQF